MATANFASIAGVKALAAKQLAKFAGEAMETVLRLQGCNASATLVSQLQSAQESLQQQYCAAQAFVDAKIQDVDQYKPYEEATERIVAYYQDRKQYATALIGVSRRQG